jgi:hypothetical protein
MNDREQAVDAIASGADLADVANAAGVDRETVREWAYRDSEFIASLNQAKRELADRLRAEVLELASDAIGVIRGIVRGEDSPHRSVSAPVVSSSRRPTR